MFISEAKTLVLEAVQRVFDEDYPNPKFANLWVSLEYPANQANYPGIWVDFAPTAPLRVAGIGHTEYVLDTLSYLHAVTRWRFGGMIQLTVVAMTSLERDLLADEIIRVIAFGKENDVTSEFRQKIEANDLIAFDMQWDTFTLTGKAETPSTPWGTDDIIYEITITVDCMGEFISGGLNQPLVPMSALAVYAQTEGEAAPTVPAPVSPLPVTIYPGNDQWQ